MFRFLLFKTDKDGPAWDLRLKRKGRNLTITILFSSRLMGERLERKVVVLGVFLLILGLSIMALPTQEAFMEKREVNVGDPWKLQSRILPPQDTTFYAKLMTPGMWFQLDISSTDLIELQISVMQDETTRIPVFSPQEATSFDQKVDIARTGTYVIDIENTSQSTVTLEGEVLTKNLEAMPNFSTYAFLGFPFMLGGTIVLIYGILKKPKKSRTKRKVY